MLTTEIFIERARKVHGDFYDYSKVEYKNNNTKVCIIDPEYGEFWQTPHHHLAGHASRQRLSKKLSEMKRMPLEDFIERARKVHGDFYDYSKVEYKNNNTKVCIIDPEYGEFWQAPYHHLKGQGHVKRSSKRFFTTATFIDELKKIYGDKYDYSKVNYINNSTKIELIYNNHSVFHTPASLLKGVKEKGTIPYTTETFIQKAQKIHGDKYDYSKVEYVNVKTKVCIICPIHGEFWQTPQMHLRGRGCGRCAGKNMDTQEFVRKAKLVHGEKYDYSKTQFVSAHKKVCITCPKHGDFWITPNSHLNGSGCAFCKESLLEKSVRVKLEELDIRHIQWYREEWLKTSINGCLSLDFYLPDYKTAIECQGGQHYKPIERFGGVECLKSNQERDRIKLERCNENGVKLLYFTNKEFSKYQPEAYYKIDDLINEIQANCKKC